MKAEMEFLGCKVRERTTGYEGVVTSVSFDLVGCVQAFVTPPFVKGKGDEGAGRWYDLSRLEVGKRVMPAPRFPIATLSNSMLVTDRDKGSSAKTAPACS
jgi:hypothetical protein